MRVLCGSGKITVRRCDRRRARSRHTASIRCCWREREALAQTNVGRRSWSNAISFAIFQDASWRVPSAPSPLFQRPAVTIASSGLARQDLEGVLGRTGTRRAFLHVSFQGEAQMIVGQREPPVEVDGLAQRALRFAPALPGSRKSKPGRNGSPDAKRFFGQQSLRDIRPRSASRHDPRVLADAPCRVEGRRYRTRCVRGRQLDIPG